LQRILVISIPDRKLAVIEDGTVKKVYPVAVGKDSTPTPAGVFFVVDRVSDPTYYHAGKVVPPGPRNPLGTRWMGLSQKGYGIHGTNASRSIGKAASHGCIRMAKADLEELFSRAQVGDTVLIRQERDQATAQIFRSYVPAVARVRDLRTTALEVSAGQ
jgi:lipoprotein-anchoring transpeptidase ErfK/SrfK